jgi:hypothetical protein
LKGVYNSVRIDFAAELDDGVANPEGEREGVYEFDGMSMRVEPVVEDGVLPLDHNNFASLFIFHYLKEESVVLQDQDQSRLVDAMEVVVK